MNKMLCPLFHQVETHEDDTPEPAPTVRLGDLSPLFFDVIENDDTPSDTTPDDEPTREGEDTQPLVRLGNLSPFWFEGE